MSKPPNRQHKKSILVVDDDPNVLTLVSGLLSDFQMPGGMSGVELATARRMNVLN